MGLRISCTANPGRGLEYPRNSTHIGALWVTLNHVIGVPKDQGGTRRHIEPNCYDYYHYDLRRFFSP